MAGAADISDYLREYHESGEILLRAKWAMDGAETLDEAAHMLRGYADELEALASAGFHLMGPVEDDLGFAHRGDEPDPDDGARPSAYRRRARAVNEPDGAPRVVLRAHPPCVGERCISARRSGTSASA